MPCCDRNDCDRVFRGPLVDHDRRAFERSGLDARQRLLLGSGDLAGARHLDLGGGIGALAIVALERGAERATVVEMSTASLTAARELAAKRGVAERLEAREGDAARLELEPADLVTLDRVVCCDPEGPALLARAATLSRRTLAFSYPVPRWWMRLGRALLNAGMRLFGRRYRFYLHDEAALLAAASSAGHHPVVRERRGVWRVVRLERSAPLS